MNTMLSPHAEGAAGALSTPMVALLTDGDLWRRRAPLFSLYADRNDTACTPLTGEALREAVLLGTLRCAEGYTLQEITAMARRHYPHTAPDGTAAGSQKEYDRWKSKAPAFTPAALCHATGGHKQKNMAALTGLLMYDFDHLADGARACAVAAALCRLPFAYAVWVTTGGRGVRLLARYLPDAAAEAVLREEEPSVEQAVRDYKAAWLHGLPVVQQAAGHAADASTKDPTRLSYLCHDAEAYFDLSLHSEKNSLVVGLDTLRPLPPAHTVKAQRRKEPFTTDAHTLATRRLEQQGELYREGHRNSYAYRYACLMLRLGATLDDCRSRIADMAPPLEAEETDRLLASAARSVQGQEGCLQHLLLPPEKRDGAKAPLTQLALDYIKEHYEVRHNLQTDQVEICPKEEAGHPNPLQRPFQPATEHSRTVNSIWVELNKLHGIDFAPFKIVALMKSDALSYEYDPIADVLHYCLAEVERDFADRPREAWHADPAYCRADGSPIEVPWQPDEDEIARLFAAIDSDMPAPLLHWIGAKWLAGMMATALNPAEKGHIMLVLQGRGGTGKTNFFKSLQLPQCDDADSLFATTNIGCFTHHNNMREALLQLGSKLLVVLDDIPEMKQSAVDLLKTWITSTTISLRPLHTNRLTSIERRCTLCGTTNLALLTDDSSAERRRIVTVQVRSIAHDGMMDRLPLHLVRLYGQAVWLYHQGLQHWLSPANPTPREQQLYDYTDRFVADSLEKQLVQTYFYPPKLDYEPRDPNDGHLLPPRFLTASEVRNKIAEFVPAMPHCVSVRSLAQALHELGYPLRRTRNKRGFILIEKPYDTRRSEAEETARHCLDQERAG